MSAARGAATRRVVLALAVLVAGCAELYRWPDRMNQPAARRAEPAPEGHYVVKAGDTLYSIAFRNQIDFRELAVWNDVGPDYLIRAGQVIRLTAPEIEASAAAPSIRTSPLEPRAPVVVPAYEPPAALSQWQWPAPGPVLRPFGDAGKGIDIGGPLGQPIFAAAAGKVVYSGSALKGYGELIIIKHDDVHLSAYGYNRRRLVGEGVTVAAGQPIAELGLGPEQKPVLHFEVRRKGKPVDPVAYLPSR
jgi:lipoprotein NlpD